MGFAGSAQPTVSSCKMVSSSSHNSDEANSGRFPMVNGGAPRYKRRRVSAVRDFPPGCGPLANRPTAEAAGAGAGAVESLGVKRERDDVPDGDGVIGSSGIGIGAVGEGVTVLPAETVGKINDVEMRGDDVGVLSDQVNRLESVNVDTVVMSVIEAVETSNDSTVVELKPVLTPVPEAVEILNDSTVVELKPVVTPVPEAVETLNASTLVELKPVVTAVPEAVETLNASTVVELKPVVTAVPEAVETLNDVTVAEPVATVLREGVETLNNATVVELLMMPNSEAVETSNNATVVEPMVTPKSEAVETLNNSAVVEPVVLRGPDLVGTLDDANKAEPLEVDKVNVAKDPSMMNVDTKTGERGIRIYPPRRRISAVRDFPPGCGRNAPCTSKDKHPEVLTSTENGCVVQTKSEAIENILQEIMKDVKHIGNVIEHADAESIRLGSISRQTLDTVKAEPDVLAIKVEKNLDEVGPSSDNGIQVAQDNIHGKGFESERDNLRKESFVNMEYGRSGKKLPEPSGSNNLVLGKGFESSVHASGRQLVLGITAERNSPWSQERGLYKHSELAGGGTMDRKCIRNDFVMLERPRPAPRTTLTKVENSGKPYGKEKSFPTKKECLVFGQMAGVDEEDHLKQSGESDGFQLVRRQKKDYAVNLPPSGPSSSRVKDSGNDAIFARKKVRETLRLFHTVCRRLLQEEEAKPKEAKTNKFRVDLLASKILKQEGKYINTGKQIVGSVSGVEIGDEFHYRVELNVIGLHRPIQGGIDYLKEGGKLFATSIVASGGYDDDTGESDVLIYSGQGGNITSADKEPEDQKLERGNLALKNSIDSKNPVRVIFGNTKPSDSTDSKGGKIYVYNGLYEVKQCWQELGSHGKLVFKFKLVRLPNQAELAWKEVKKSKNFKAREGICVSDISEGKESIPICAVNTVDSEKPPPFQYVTKMIYPDWCNPIAPKGCDCINGCSDLVKCSCVAKNGGEIPFNHNGAIVQTKPLVFECGPSCKCPPSCHNRVSQHGIRFQLEIFKTESRGWGVRSLNSIPSGSFICEYAGELLEEKEAELRTGNDEYLFDIGNQYDDFLAEELLAIMPKAHLNAPRSNAPPGVENCGFTIDAAQYGNVGRFINHSCSPNLYAQNVIYDHDDKRIPHIMFFAAENIPPLQELAYDYNYMQDQVFDSSGNVKKKKCYCGSIECTGWMY